MIMRIFQVRTRPGKEAEFAEFFHNTAIPLMKGTEGIVQVLAGAPHDDPRNFSVVMVLCGRGVPFGNSTGKSTCLDRSAWAIAMET